MVASLLGGGRFPHAVLLEGEPGSGRTALAKYIAAALLCSEEDKPCGVCAACRKVEKDIHPDVAEESGNGPRSFHVDQVRRVKTDAYIRPNEGRAKVYLLKNAQDMTAQAQNALLKVIEEPPGEVYFILMVDNRSRLFSTILSRCTQIPLERPSAAQIEELLPELRPGKDSGAYTQAAALCGGSIGKALQMLDEETHPAEEAARNALAALFGRGEYEALRLLGGFEKDRDGLLRLLEEMSRMAKGFAVRPQEMSVSFPKIKPPGRLQAVRVADIIEDTALMVRGNGNSSLACAALCGRVTEALSRR